MLTKDQASSRENHKLGPESCSSPPPSVALEDATIEAVERLGLCCGASFHVLDCETGEMLWKVADSLPRDWSDRQEVCRELFRRNQAAYIEEESPVVVLAVPLPEQADARPVALASFVTSYVTSPDVTAAAARCFKVEEKAFFDWSKQQTPHNADRLVATAQLLVDQWASTQELNRLRGEIEQVSGNLVSTYEEISLLHRLAQNLKISHGDVELGRLALEWLGEVVPAKGLTIWYDHRNQLEQPQIGRNPESIASSESVVVHQGVCALDDDQFESLFTHLGESARKLPVVVNQNTTSKPGWPFPAIRELVCVPLSEGGRVFGYLLATNHKEGKEFGTVEASLLNSVASILGIHSGNILLYHEQAEFLSQMVHALTSAIDAKDPYTCGHSNRVAQVAVRLGEEVGCDEKMLNTLYLGGLLHDIGKIGIEDSVLRKPGRLTEAEFEHIKQHPELGYKILKNVSRLDEVLPIVLHHHESWDGSGYPHSLAGDETALSARITAVADAFDAMSSDRPYRPGMSDEKLDHILREGAGRQWDARVVAAFFAARDDIREIANQEREELNIEVEQWI